MSKWINYNLINCNLNSDGDEINDLKWSSYEYLKYYYVVVPAKWCPVINDKSENLIKMINSLLTNKLLYTIK